MCVCRKVDSLFTLSIDCVIKNLSKYITDDIDTIKNLPFHVKDRLLRKFTSTSHFQQNLDFKKTLSCLVHAKSQHINLTLENLDDDILNIIKCCRDMQRAYLTNFENDTLSSESLIDVFQHLKNIRRLQISNCFAVNDDVVVSISKNCPMLRILDVGGCTNITDKSLEAIAPMKRLGYLTLSKTQITNEGVTTLVRGSSQLQIKELTVANCPNITNEVLTIISDHCPQIEVLVFYNSNKCEDQTNFFLQEGSLKNLKQLTWSVSW